MIDPRYVKNMALYNSWQNSQLIPTLETMSCDEITMDRGGFFSGLLATANHLLWGDTLWMSRFDPTVDAPEGGIKHSVGLHQTATAWAADRCRVDGKIRVWADGLRAIDLKKELKWYSAAAERDVTAPLEMTIMHFFNHQTHHRGQIHAMLTAAGQRAPVSDLFLMPEDI